MTIGKKTAFCLDIGGTYIKYAFISDDGQWSDFKKQQTNKNGTEGLIKQIIEIIGERLAQTNGTPLCGIGISSAGQVNHKKGQILYATDNLPGWTGLDIKNIIEQRFQIPCCIDNDVNCVALGEMYYGNAKGFEDFVCITIGTGIGGAIVKDSKLIHGYVGSAGEVGHMIIKAGGRKCNCGNRGCYEQYASVTAFKREIVQKLGRDCPFSEKEIEWLIANYHTNPKVKKLVDDYVKYLALGIVNMLHIFNPAAVIIGGFISGYDFFLHKIDRAVQAKTMPEFIKNLKILPALLDNKAALFGVSSYLFKNVP